MKILIFLCLMILPGVKLSAQEQVIQSLTEAMAHCQQALKAAKRTSEHFGFLNGAYDRAEINRHLTDARGDLDSLRYHTQAAAYQSSDAAYFAKSDSLELPEQQALGAKKLFQSASQTLDDITKKIDEFIIHGTSNEDAYLNQRLEDFEQAKQQLLQAHQKLQQAIKLVTSAGGD